MKTHNSLFLGFVALFCSAFFCINANARVCFIADGDDCAITTTFGEYQDPTIITSDKCREAGYTPITACPMTPGSGMQIAEYCPYNPDFVKCCGLDYAYAACIYPLIQDGRCGSKYRCKCDSAVYKYTSAHSCTTAGFQSARPGGSSCSHIRGLEAGVPMYETAFKNCVCDRSLYPYSAKDCEASSSEATGGFCIASEKDDQQQSKYFAACVCNRNTYKHTNDSCPFGGNNAGDYCIQAGMWFFKACCSCGGYPAEGDIDSGPKDPYVFRGIGANEKPLGYDVCPCVKGYTKYKIKRCISGWKPSKGPTITNGVKVYNDFSVHTNKGLEEGEECVPISCEEATMIYLARNSTNNYRLWKGGSSFFTYKIKMENGVEVLDAQGVPVLEETSHVHSASMIPVVAGNINVASNLASGAQVTNCSATCVATSVISTSSASMHNVPVEPPANCTGTLTIINSQNLPTVTWLDSDLGGEVDEADIDEDADEPGTDRFTHQYCSGWTYATTGTSTASLFSGLGNTNAREFSSSRWIASANTGASFDILRNSCRKNPTLNFTGLNFPSTTQSANTIRLNGIELNFGATGTTIVNVNVPLYVYNADLTSLNTQGTTLTRAVTFKSALYLYLSTTPNRAPDATFRIDNANIDNYLYSDGYGYDVTTLRFRTVRNHTIGSIYLNVGQRIKAAPATGSGGGIYLIPPTNNPQQNWGSYLRIYGPNNAAGASGYGNIYVGSDNSTIHARRMYVELDRNMTWSTYNPSNTGQTFRIYVSADSRIRAQNNSKLQFLNYTRTSCTMADKQKWCVVEKSAKLNPICTGRDKWNETYQAVCNITASGTIAGMSVSIKGSEQNCGSGNNCRSVFQGTGGVCGKRFPSGAECNTVRNNCYVTQNFLTCS